MLNRIKQWLGLNQSDELNAKETSPLEMRANRLIFRSQTITNLREASQEIQSILDSEELTLDQMLRIGELYEKQIGRIMLMSGEIEGLNISFHQTDEENILTTKS